MKSFLKHLLIGLLPLLLVASCATRKDIVYLQKVVDQQEWEVLSQEGNITLSPNDKISIVINSKDPAISSLFNLPVTTYQVGSGEGYSLYGSPKLSLYTISEQGKVEIPILGQVHLSGLTRDKAAKRIKTLLEEKSLIKSPIVTVEFANLAFSILGEVNRPGRQLIDRDKITLLDAIGMAGDLTIHGKRDNILVLRQERDKRKAYRVDLRSDSLYDSPAYYIQQNDIVYIEPNKMKARQSTVNGNSVLSASFWMSLASLGTTIALFFLRK